MVLTMTEPVRPYRPGRGRHRRQHRHRPGDRARAGRSRRRRRLRRPDAGRGNGGQGPRAGPQGGDHLRRPVDHRAGRARRRRDARQARAARHPGQQRRHHPPRRRGRFHRGGLGRGDRHQSEVGVLPQPGGGAAHDRGWQRPDRQHRLDADLSGRHPRAELYRVQIGGRRADQIAGQRMGGERRAP